jgi:hypothetical protein
MGGWKSEKDIPSMTLISTQSQDVKNNPDDLSLTWSFGFFKIADILSLTLF